METSMIWLNKLLRSSPRSRTCLLSTSPWSWRWSRTVSAWQVNTPPWFLIGWHNSLLTPDWLTGLPLLLPNFCPWFGGLPLYIIKLATEVNWESEKECFQTFAQETASFYSCKEVEGRCPRYYSILISDGGYRITLISDWLIGMIRVSTAQILRWTGSTLLSIVCIQQSRSPCCHQNSVSMIRP